MKIVPHLRIRLTLLAVIALCIAGPTRAQEAEWQRLYKEAVSLYTQGNHAQAMDAARESLTVAEKPSARIIYWSLEVCTPWR
ncbi:MAG: hypothetical protein IPH08_05960 [Rhodocyclaceae bacterium]|nr:hypothetical protein [Rhodocyclaceae bacterium]